MRIHTLSVHRHCLVHMRPPPPLLVPSSTPTTFQCRASRQLVEGDYVLQIVAQDDGSYWAGCSDGTIRQLDGELRSRTTLRRDGLTSLCGAGAEPHARTNAFVATASDGSAVGYDARDTRRPAFSIQTKVCCIRLGAPSSTDTAAEWRLLPVRSSEQRFVLPRARHRGPEL